VIQETLVVRENNSAQSELGGIIVSAVETNNGRAKLVVGRPGSPNLESTLSTGGAALFETPEGLFEVRVMSTTAVQVTVLLTQVSPRPGFAGGFVEQDSDNAPFTSAELVRIATSFQQIQRILSERSDVSPEQLDFVSRKLDDVQRVAEKLGRKDWINLVLGTLSSIVVSAAFSDPVRSALFQTAGAALSWLISGSVKLLP
jgi:hypothetical protein